MGSRHKLALGLWSGGRGHDRRLVVFLLRRGTLSGIGDQPAPKPKHERQQTSAQLTGEEWRRVGAIVILFAFTVLFWAAYEQKGASLNLFAKQLVDTRIGGWEFPASWLQSLTPSTSFCSHPSSRASGSVWVTASPPARRSSRWGCRHRLSILPAGSSLQPDCLRQDQSTLARSRLLSGCCGRDVPKPGRPQHSDEGRRPPA